MIWQRVKRRRGLTRAPLLAGIALMLGLLLLPAAGVGATRSGRSGLPAACNAPYNLAFRPAEFRDSWGRPYPVDNPYFPLDPGTTWVYEGTVDGEFERGVVEVTDDTRVIQAVRVVEVHDQVFADLDDDGDLDLAEDTLDWYAQDRAGNVWYLGEDTRELDEHGNVVSTDGTWQAGVDGARPGIVMPAQPRVGDVYRQEYLPGVAEDMARVLRLDRHVNVPYGAFDRVLQTEEWACHDPGAPRELKYYARGVGFIKVSPVRGSGSVVLVAFGEEDD